MQNQITEGPILRPLLFYFFPILLGTFFQQFYNTVDAIIVGNFVGTAALGAVGGATSVIINFLVNLFVGLSSGATVVIARYYGARQGEELRKAVHTAAAIALTAGVLITALGLVLADPVLRLMGTPSDVMGYAQVYLKVYFSGTIASFIYNMGSSVLRAVGDNATLVTTLAKDRGTVKILGLVISNALVAFGGCIVCHETRSFSATMGTGQLVYGLAAVIIGVSLMHFYTGTRLARGLRKSGPLRFLGSPQGTTAVVLGSVLYKLCIQVAMSLGLPTNMMKLITAALFLLVLVLSGRKGEAIIHA